MNRYIVRPTLVGQDKMSGKTGAQSIVVRAETAEQARRDGSSQLGLSPSQVEVHEMDDSGTMLIANMPAEMVAEALKNRGDQDTAIHDPRARPMT